MSDKVREAFEVWAVENMFSPDIEAGEERDDVFRSSRRAFILSVHDGDTYSIGSLASAWDGWRGGRKAMLEEAMHAVKYGPLCKGCKRVGRNAIRALAQGGAA